MRLLIQTASDIRSRYHMGSCLGRKREVAAAVRRSLVSIRNPPLSASFVWPASPIPKGPHDEATHDPLPARDSLRCNPRYVGGSRDDSPRGGLTLDEQDCVYVVGTSNSPNFPTTPGVFQPQLDGPRDSTIVKLKANGLGLVFGTLLGGSGEDDAIMGVRLDTAGNVYVAGHARSSDFPVTPAAVQSKLASSAPAVGR